MIWSRIPNISTIGVHLPHTASRRIARVIEYLGSPLTVLFFIVLSFLRTDTVPVVWILAGWDLYTAIWLAFAIVFISHMTSERTQRWANNQSESTVGLDRIRPSHFVTTASIVVLSLFGLVFAFVLFALASTGTTYPDLLAFVLSWVAIVLSWLSLNTAYTLYYASLYYRNRNGTRGEGFKFAGEESPALLDFAYFAFTVGTTFGTSDVVVVSSWVRKHVLVHTLLSFWYTTGILAFVVNFAVSYG